MTDWLYFATTGAATTLLVASFFHHGYALVSACRWTAFFLFLGLLIGATPHVHGPEPFAWLGCILRDLALVGVLVRAQAPRGAIVAAYASAALCLTGLTHLPGTEAIYTTIILAYLYYLALAPRLWPRDRRLSDRLPTC